ncbi:MAG: helix-turn-helix domain-containing protein, partial [Ardenticatenales bacterium]|nr:helix-turn-helix domain-containing protein [Ardenticatenales bacterium]
MDELGEILREAREAKGLTLEQAFAETRISQRFLAAMEAGDYDELPTPVHVRGYLRNYARFLSLDPAPLLERYENSTRKRPPLPTPNPERTPIEVAAPLPVRDDQPFFDPVNVELGAQTVKDSSATIRLGIIAAAIITLTLIAVRFVPILLGGDDGMSAIQDAVGNLLSTEETEPEAVPDGAVLAATGEPAVETSRNTSGTVDVDPEAA